MDIFVAQTLTSVNLYHNEIDEQGIKYLANALKINKVFSRFFSH